MTYTTEFDGDKKSDLIIVEFPVDEPKFIINSDFEEKENFKMSSNITLEHTSDTSAPSMFTVS